MPRQRTYPPRQIQRSQNAVSGLFLTEFVKWVGGINVLEVHMQAAYFLSNNATANFLTTCALSQIAPLSDPYNPLEFVKTILLHSVHLCSNSVCIT